MTDKGIVRQIMPYVLIFTCALGYAGVEFSRQVAAPASADSSNITVDVSPVSTESVEGEEWVWNVSTFVDSYFKNAFQLDYIVDWCTSDLSKGTDTKACSAEFTNGRYKKTLTRGVIDIKTRDSLQAIRHESVPCGSARITVRRSGEVVGFREVDTEKQCPTLTTTGLQAEETEEGLPSDNIVELINDLFSIGKSSSDTLDTQEVPDNVDRPSPGVPPGSGTPGPPGSGTPAPPGSGTPGPPSNTTVCQGTDALFVPGTEYKLGSIRNDCMRPTRIIIHWSGAWNSAEATLNTLNSRGLSCQLATDSSHGLQMLDFFGTESEHAWCAGGGANDGSLNIEITGNQFDGVYNDPSHSRYKELMASTSRAVAQACWMLGQYGLDKNSAIFGHFELHDGKPDPGPGYLEFFKQEVKKAC